MTPTAQVRPARPCDVVRLRDSSPANPFATPQYFESRTSSGWSAWVASLLDDAGDVTAGCGVFVTRKGPFRKVEIPSLPLVAADSPFWDCLRAFCCAQRVTKLEIGSFCSPPGVGIPIFGISARRTRGEYIIDLDGDLYPRLDGRHRSSINKARRQGLVVRRIRSPEAVAAHQSLVARSMARRRVRGEDAPEIDSSLEPVALLRSGTGELFQVLEGDTVVSSGLVLKAPAGAYGHSTGTSAQGMAKGASHFLQYNVALALRDEGLSTFNLGSAEEESELARFKRRFGARIEERKPAVTAYVGPALRRDAYRVAELLRGDPGHLLQSLARRFSYSLLYDIETATATAVDPPPGMTLRRLSAEDLRGLHEGDGPFRDCQLERLDRFGDSFAWGVLIDDRLAHVAWLLPPEAVKRDVPRVLHLRAGEAEITCTETLPEFRGRECYPAQVRHLVCEARAEGVHRIVMKVSPANAASRRGVEKAGLRQAGTVVALRVPFVDRCLTWRCRQSDDSDTQRTTRLR